MRYGLGAVDSVTLDFSGGAPSVFDPNVPTDSVNFDFSQGYAVAPGAPGSVGPDGKIITGIQVAPDPAAKAPTPINPLYVAGGIAAVLFLFAGMGGRR